MEIKNSFRKILMSISFLAFLGVASLLFTGHAGFALKVANILFFGLIVVTVYITFVP